MDQIDYDAIRARVERRFRERRRFTKSIQAFVWMNVSIWGLWYLTGQLNNNTFPLPALLTLLWGVSLVMRGIRVYFFPSHEDARERAFEREIERERRRIRRGLPEPQLDFEGEKAKRGVVRLSDDGELVYEDEPKRSASREDV
jgi:hypothetical protein